MSRSARRLPKRDPEGRLPGERGVALVMAILVMLVLSAIAVALISSVNVETKISGSNARSSRALNLAEAGAAEAIARIRSGDVPDTLNPRMVTQIFNTVAGAVPALGVDSVGLATRQPLGTWLSYSTATRDSTALTVTYRTNPARTAIFRYDPSQDPAIQTTTGMPIFVIKSTGRSGKNTRTIVTEVVRKPIVVTLLGAVSTHSVTTHLWCGSMAHGPFMYNGMNHRADTPTDAGNGGPDPANYVGSGDLPAFWSVSPITYGGNFKKGLCCTPQGDPAGILENQPAPQFYVGPWQPLGMTQAEFYKWIGPRKTTVPGTLSGITYLDNDNIGQNGKGSWTLNGVSGSGFLYVDGSLTINGDFHWRGLIYCEDHMTFNGPLWVLGGLVAAEHDAFQIKHVRATILYSHDAISQAINTSSNQLYTLSWREVR